MGIQKKPTIVSGTGAALSGLWGFYSTINTASDLPEDFGGLAKMMADPPIYLPWLILAACVIVLAWSLWPRSEEEKPSEDRGGTFSQDHSGSGDNNMNF